MNSEHDVHQLRDDVKRLLAAALQSEEAHVADVQRRDELHIDEIQRRDELHVSEIGRREALHADDQERISHALETRDLIGQAKGVIMSSLGCTADEAFDLLVKQSQHENRKLVEIAGEIASHTHRRK